MNACRTNTPPVAKHPLAGDTWIQITFTIDPEHYRVLWDRAEEARLTVPGFVRESVIDFLKALETPSRENKISLKTTSRRRS